jgi:hypothetical protein
MNKIEAVSLKLDELKNKYRSMKYIPFNLFLELIELESELKKYKHKTRQ